jgi:hypothetical protein
VDVDRARAGCRHAEVAHEVVCTRWEMGSIYPDTDMSCMIDHGYIVCLIAPCTARSYKLTCWLLTIDAMSCRPDSLSDGSTGRHDHASAPPALL